MNIYKGKRVLVTGGLGFIGSSLAIRLVAMGAVVTIVDSSVPGCGANAFNIDPIKDVVEVLPEDIANASCFQSEIARTDIVFNLAGEISHSESMRCPERDLNINTLAQLRFLLACRAARPRTRVIYASTRQVYGRARYLPVDERHPLEPVDFNGIHKYAATEYHLMLSRLGQLDATVLRLSNVYGPRMALNVPQQGFLGTFVRLSLVDQPVTVYGDGDAVRDPIYVDDAVEAFLLAGARLSSRSRVYNVGGPESLPVSTLADLTAEAAGSSPPVSVAFPAMRKAIDIGSYVSNSDRIRRELGWRPRTPFREGIGRTLAYYREHRSFYLPGPDLQMALEPAAFEEGATAP